MNPIKHGSILVCLLFGFFDVFSQSGIYNNQHNFTIHLPRNIIRIQNDNDSNAARIIDTYQLNSYIKENRDKIDTNRVWVFCFLTTNQDTLKRVEKILGENKISKPLIGLTTSILAPENWTDSVHIMYR